MKTYRNHFPVCKAGWELYLGDRMLRNCATEKNDYHNMEEIKTCGKLESGCIHGCLVWNENLIKRWVDVK